MNDETEARDQIQMPWNNLVQNWHTLKSNVVSFLYIYNKCALFEKSLYFLIYLRVCAQAARRHYMLADQYWCNWNKSRGFRHSATRIFLARQSCDGLSLRAGSGKGPVGCVKCVLDAQYCVKQCGYYNSLGCSCWQLLAQRLQIVAGDFMWLFWIVGIWHSRTSV
jgi:hypothetical protein